MDDHIPTQAPYENREHHLCVKSAKGKVFRLLGQDEESRLRYAANIELYWDEISATELISTDDGIFSEAGIIDAVTSGFEDKGFKSLKGLYKWLQHPTECLNWIGDGSIESGSGKWDMPRIPGLDYQTMVKYGYRGSHSGINAARAIYVVFRGDLPEEFDDKAYKMGRFCMNPICGSPRHLYLPCDFNPSEAKIARGAERREAEDAERAVPVGRRFRFKRK